MAILPPVAFCACPDHGVAGSGEPGRRRVLQLLALLEHPEALPGPNRLRLGQEILALLAHGRPALRCRGVRPGEAAP